MRRLTRALAIIALTIWCLHGGRAFADDYGAVTGDDAKTQSQIDAEADMARADWKDAAPLLEAHLAGFPDDDLSAAELGHVYDELGDKDSAIYWLNYALFIAPRSLEGNLYLGEYDLGLHDKAGAIVRLRKLDEICFFGCPEYRALRQAIRQYGTAHS
jgi:tetratricopeptide (TPR) repeat protein